jgi:hypothetical protein
MAEPQRISSLPDPPPRRRPAPKLVHHARPAAPPRLPIDATQDLRPPGTPRPSLAPASLRQVQSTEPEDRDLDGLAEERRAGRARHAQAARRPSRTPAEWALLTVLLFGLGLNAAVLLLNVALTRADVLLGATVLLAGVVLLALMEICRRGGPADPSAADR